MMLYGSLCLSQIPRELIKKVMCKDGKERCFLNISIIERKEKSQFGDTHFVSCAPKKEERKENINYIFGDLKTYEPTPNTPTQEQINSAPSVTADDNLPF